MEIVSACLLLFSLPDLSTTLSITPNRSQFFLHDEIFLKCATPANSSGWIVRRNTAFQKSQPCQFGWAIPGDSSCEMDAADTTDTGVYWCQSESGERSNTVNITVADGVILDSPLFPVMEGEKVTLGCSYKERTHYESTSDFSASFYKNDVFIGTERKMVFKEVSKSDEGFYKCEHPSKGKSKPTWLSVTVRDELMKITSTVPPTSLAQTSDIWMLVGAVLLLILYSIVTIVSIYVHRKLARVRAYAKRRAAGLYEEE